MLRHIGRFGRCLQLKAIGLDPNGIVAEWILLELQTEAAEWSREATGDGKVYYHRGASGLTQWDKPQILIEMQRCEDLGPSAEV